MLDYEVYSLYTTTPDGYEDLDFSVKAYVSDDGEEVDIDLETLKIEPVEGYDTAELKAYVLKLFEDKEKNKEYEQEIRELAYNRAEAKYYDGEDCGGMDCVDRFKQAHGIDF